MNTRRKIQNKRTELNEGKDFYLCISNQRAKNTFLQIISIYEKKGVNLQFVEG